MECLTANEGTILLHMLYFINEMSMLRMEYFAKNVEINTLIDFENTDNLLGIFQENVLNPCFVNNIVG